jgi:hypothetical protein
MPDLIKKAGASAPKRPYDAGSHGKVKRSGTIASI